MIGVFCCPTSVKHDFYHVYNRIFKSELPVIREYWLNLYVKEHVLFYKNIVNMTFVMFF